MSSRRSENLDNEPREPLTREQLERALVVHLRYWKGSTDKEQEENADEWFDFMCIHGLEALGLALAAVGKLEPRRPGAKYAKHTFGKAQQKMIDALRIGPMTALQLAEVTGIYERNLRRNLVAMRSRGWLVSNGKLWSIGELPSAKPSE